MDFTHASIAGHSILSMLQLPRDGTTEDAAAGWEITHLPDYFGVKDLNIYIHGDFNTNDERTKLAADIVDGILLCCSEDTNGNFEAPPAVERFPEKFRITIKGMPEINIFPAFKPDQPDVGTSVDDPFPPLSLAQLLHSFDIDSHCVAYTGSKVVTTLRGIRAICSRINVANPSYKSSTKYEDRLFECWKRGYTIAIPNANSVVNLHVRESRFRTHSIDIPRIHTLCYPEDRTGGDNGVPFIPAVPFPVRRRARGFFARLGRTLDNLRFMVEPLWY